MSSTDLASRSYAMSGTGLAGTDAAGLTLRVPRKCAVLRYRSHRTGRVLAPRDAVLPALFAELVNFFANF
eukprot:2906672-Rhodomonas_salina.1